MDRGMMNRKRCMNRKRREKHMLKREEKDLTMAKRIL
jgi:hypothetical protein